MDKSFKDSQPPKTYAEKIFELEEVTIENYSGKDKAYLEGYLERLMVGLNETHAKIQEKLKQIEHALAKGEAHDVLRILFLEYQQKVMVLRDLERNLMILQTLLRTPKEK